MEKFFNFIAALAVSFVFMGVFLGIFFKSIEKEQQRQCEKALEWCDKYEDAGACDDKYLSVCYEQRGGNNAKQND